MKMQEKIVSLHSTALITPAGDRLQRRSTNGAGPTAAPPIVHEVLNSPGHTLDMTTRGLMESRFGHDFSRVRVHTDAKAEASAWAVNARAYTFGMNVVFGAGQYAPQTMRGQRLLTHELMHVVQQGGTSSAPVGLYRQAEEGEKDEPEKPGGKAGKEIKFKIPPDRMTGPSPFTAPSPSATEKPTEPKMPSRIPLSWLSTGSVSIGLRLGFPELPERTDLQKRLFSGAPDIMKESLQRANIINQTLTGKVPSGWEATDKGQLASAIWGIFSTNIAPGLASKITSGLSTTTKAGGLSYELDLVLLTDFSKEIGGGASFTVRW